MEWTLDTDTPLAGRRELRGREARLEDLAVILEIERAAHPTPWSEDIFLREFELERSHCWLASRVDAASEAAIAFLVFWVVHDEVHVLDVAVHPESRRQGIATALMRQLMEQARHNQASFITLEVRIHNQAAIGLYESLGFEIIGERERYYADTGEDALIMSCLL